MKTNIITINTIMTKATKYICAIVLMLGFSTSAWADYTYTSGSNLSATVSSQTIEAETGEGESGEFSLSLTLTDVANHMIDIQKSDDDDSNIEITAINWGENELLATSSYYDVYVYYNKKSSDPQTYTLTVEYNAYEAGTYNATLTITDYVSYPYPSISIPIVFTVGAASCDANATFTTTGTPTTTSSLRSTSVSVNNVGLSSLGATGCAISSYGYCWGTSANPTTSGSHYEVGTTYTTTGTAFGSYSITGLTANQKYYIRPYATNGNGTAYGPEVNVTTLKQFAIDLLKNNLDAGSKDGVAYVEENGTSFLESEAPTRTGYDVEGYYTDAACTAANKVATSAGALRASISVSEVAWTNSSSQWVKGGTAEFYTKWTAHTHSLSWNSNGGNALTGDYTSGASIAYGTTIVKPNTPTRSGYVFDGWAESAGGSVVDVPATMPDADKSYYAKWHAATYTNYTFACAELELEEPANGADNVISDVVYMTSTSGQKVRSLAKFHVTGTGLTANKEVKFTTGDDDLDAIFSFKDGNGNAISTNASGAVDADVYIFYQPTATSDGRDIITAVGGIRAYVERNADGGKPRSVKNTARTINGRHLPSQFIIAAKSGGVWYALPSDASVTGAQMGYTFTPDDATTPTKANVAPQTALYSIYAPRADGTNKSYVRLASTNDYKTLWSNSSTTYGIKDNALVTGTSSKGDQYEWRLENTGADSYKLWNNASYSGAGRYLGIKGTKWNVFNAAGDVVQDLKILPVDAVSAYIGLSATDWEETAFNFTVTSGSVPDPYDHAQVAYNGNQYDASISGTKLTINDADFTEAGGFTAAPGSQLIVEWCNNTNAVLAQGSVISPIIINSNTVNLSDYDAEALVGTDIFITNGAELTINENTTVHDVTVNSGATLFVNKTAGGDGVTMNLSSGKLALKGGWNSDYTDYDMPRVYINPLSSLAKTNTTVNFDISVDSRNYYPFAVPFEVEVKDVDYVNPTLAGASVYGTHYVIKEYNGAGRAEYGSRDENWVVVSNAAGTKLQPGKGYILTAVSIPAYGGGVIRFPMKNVSNAWTTNGEQATVSDKTKNVLTVTAHEGTATTGGGANNRHKGWNMLGVPFMSCYTSGTDMYTGEGSADLMTGRMELSGDPADPYAWESGEAVYVSVPTHDFSEYIQTDITTAKLVPGWSFFVQVGTTGNLTFLTTEQRENSDMPIYAPRREAEKSPVVKTGIVLSDGEKSDKTTLLISDRYSSEYEIGADLEKMFGNAFTLSTYSITNGTNLAFNALSTYEAQQAIPVGVRIPADGQYTFSLNPRYADANIARLDLIDYEAGEVTNLMTDSYTFTMTQGENTARFALNVTMRQETPTDIETVSGEGLEVSGARKMIINDKLYILREGVMYDATGKKVGEVIRNK